MQLEECLKGIQNAIAIIQTKFQHESDLICFQYGSGSLTNYGEYLVILCVSSQRTPQHGMNEAELQTYLEEHILSRSLISPNENQFVAMINALVLAKALLLRNRSEILQLLKELMQALRSNQFQREMGLLQSTQPLNPKIALHSLIREDTFAFVFQILELKGHKGSRESKPSNTNKIDAAIIKTSEKLPGPIPKDFTPIIATLEQEKLKLEQIVRQKDQDFETLQIQFKELTEERNRLLEAEHEKYGANQRIAELESAISNMKVKMYDYLEQKKKAESDRNTAFEESEIIKGKFSTLEQQIQTLTEDNTQLQTEKISQQAKFDEQIEGLNKILHELEEKYSKLHAEHKENQEKSTNLEQLLGDYKTQTEELQTSLQNQQIIQENIVDQIQNIANDMKSPMMKMDKLIESIVKTSKH